jgi:Na+/H+-dicarboxylate symporter
MLTVIRRISLTGWIVLAIGAGVLAGWLWPRQAQELQFISNIFLRLIKCVVVPLIFATLVVGVAGHAADWKTVGRLALKSLVYFEVITTAALCVGLAVVNVARPGAGLHLAAGAAAADATPPRSVYRAYWNMPRRKASSMRLRATTSCKWWCSPSCLPWR